MVRCPNCGSTAQLRPMRLYITDKNEVMRQLVCGCGAITKMVYTQKEMICKDRDGKIVHQEGK